MSIRQAAPAVLLIFLLGITATGHADTVHLKNGSKLEGVIESENPQGIQLNVGYGTMTFLRSEILRIDRSGPEQTQEIWNAWAAKKQQSASEAVPAKTRQERLDAAAKLREEYARKKKEKEEGGPKEIEVTSKDGQMLVNVLLNGTARVTLILDSGAAYTVIYNRAFEQLGLDLSTLKKRQGVVADGSLVDQYELVLDSVKVQPKGVTGTAERPMAGVEALNVEARVIPKETGLVNGQPDRLYDGLLGMSFLRNFKFNADYEHNKITFERIGTDTEKDPG